jgi:anaerobic magnesium-protoporphyrin IX monomethyl ester cyclase
LLTNNEVGNVYTVVKPNVQVVVGGYDPTLATESYTGSGPGQVDFIVRGEGELTFRAPLRAIETGSPYDRITGLSYRVGDHFHHNRERLISGLDKGEIRPPKRSARVLSGYTMLGRQVDVIENLSRLHFRLQLLLDRRNARPKLRDIFVRSSYR